jgi:DNA-binding HxlR family transcriptional regulator
MGAEIFAERWTPLILRELLGGARRFTDIQRGVPRMSRNLLAQRLVSLQKAGIVDRHAASKERGPEYHLTEAGRELRDVVESLGTWGYKWASKDLTDEHLDPDFVMWALYRNVRIDQLPDGRVVVLVKFRGDTKHQYWLVLKRPEVDLCISDPGFEVDLEMRAELQTMARVTLGHLALAQAMKAGSIELTGAPRHRRGLCNWLGVTHFAATAHR